MPWESRGQYVPLHRHTPVAHWWKALRAVCAVRLWPQESCQVTSPYTATHNTTLHTASPPLLFLPDRCKRVAWCWWTGTTCSTALVLAL